MCRSLRTTEVTHDLPEWQNWRESNMSSQVTSPNTEAAILARLIELGQDNLSSGAAEYLLSIHFDERDIARMNELSDLAQEGRLTGDQQSELDSYIHVSNLIAAMQSRARRALQPERR